MLPLSEIPVRLRFYCVECKAVTTHRFVGFYRNGYGYRCETCGRLRILEEGELLWIMSQPENLPS